MNEAIGEQQQGQQTIPRFRRALRRWYAKEQRSFLWRATHPDPYIVLISEFMLQQTQAARVQELLPRFLERYPDVATLAASDNAQVIVAWRGLGYNSRALRLRDCARQIVERHQGHIPRHEAELRALPGIGPYTAAAIRVFAFHDDIPVIDVNVRRVYSRVFAPMTRSDSVLPTTLLDELSRRVFPKGDSSAWHQAVMDLGAQICIARSARCQQCPLKSFCASAHLMQNAPRSVKQEPSHRGTPNRIWRGRIVDALRGASRHTLTRRALLTKLFSDPQPSDDLWLNDVLQALQRDSIIRVRTKSVALAT